MSSRHYCDNCSDDFHTRYGLDLATHPLVKPELLSVLRELDQNRPVYDVEEFCCMSPPPGGIPFHTHHFPKESEKKMVDIVSSIMTWYGKDLLEKHYRYNQESWFAWHPLDEAMSRSSEEGSCFFCPNLLSLDLLKPIPLGSARVAPE